MNDRQFVGGRYTRLPWAATSANRRVVLDGALNGPSSGRAISGRPGTAACRCVLRRRTVLDCRQKRVHQRLGLLLRNAQPRCLGE